MEIRIGSLNCLNFGRESIGKKDIKIIAGIILREKLDIIALQEVKSEEAVKIIVSELNSRSIYAWKWFCDKNDPRQEYAFVWNSNKLDYPKTKLPSGEIRIYYPHIYKQYGRDPQLGKLNLVRPPLYGRFQTIFPGLPSIELRLINTHIRYSKGKDGELLPASAAEKDLRESELKALTKHIYYHVSDKGYGAREGEGDPRTSYTILLGDYNLNLRESHAGSPYISEELVSIDLPSRKTDKGGKKIITVQSDLSTLKKMQETKSQQTEKFANNYDHFTLDKNRFSGVSYTAERVDTVEKYCDNDLQKHYEKVSDHVLIKMTLRL